MPLYTWNRCKNHNKMLATEVGEEVKNKHKKRTDSQGRLWLWTALMSVTISVPCTCNHSLHMAGHPHAILLHSVAQGTGSSVAPLWGDVRDAALSTGKCRNSFQARKTIPCTQWRHLDWDLLATRCSFYCFSFGTVVAIYYVFSRFMRFEITLPLTLLRWLMTACPYPQFFFLLSPLVNWTMMITHFKAEILIASHQSLPTTTISYLRGTGTSHSLHLCSLF